MRRRLIPPDGVRLGLRRIRSGDEDALLPGEIDLPTAVARVFRQSGAARIVARRLLREEGVVPGAIRRGVNGQPVWPCGIVGSLAHDDDVAIAAIARAEAFLALGVDVEPDLPLPDATAGMVATEAERARYDAGILGSRLLFCLKEAAFKAFHGLEPAFLDFPDMEVDLDQGTCRTAAGHEAKLAWTRGTRIIAIATISRPP